MYGKFLCCGRFQRSLKQALSVEYENSDSCRAYCAAWRVRQIITHEGKVLSFIHSFLFCLSLNMQYLLLRLVERSLFILVSVLLYLLVMLLQSIGWSLRSSTQVNATADWLAYRRLNPVSWPQHVTRTRLCVRRAGLPLRVKLNLWNNSSFWRCGTYFQEACLNP